MSRRQHRRIRRPAFERVENRTNRTLVPTGNLPAKYASSKAMAGAYATAAVSSAHRLPYGPLLTVRELFETRADTRRFARLRYASGYENRGFVGSVPNALM